jgi:hypothetical protein
MLGVAKLAWVFEPFEDDLLKNVISRVHIAHNSRGHHRNSGAFAEEHLHDLVGLHGHPKPSKEVTIGLRRSCHKKLVLSSHLGCQGSRTV